MELATVPSENPTTLVPHSKSPDRFTPLPDAIITNILEKLSLHDVGSVLLTSSKFLKSCKDLTHINLTNLNPSVDSDDLCCFFTNSKILSFEFYQADDIHMELVSSTEFRELKHKALREWIIFLSHKQVESITIVVESHNQLLYEMPRNIFEIETLKKLSLPSPLEKLEFSVSWRFNNLEVLEFHVKNFSILETISKIVNASPKFLELKLSFRIIPISHVKKEVLALNLSNTNMVRLNMTGEIKIPRGRACLTLLLATPKLEIWSCLNADLKLEGDYKRRRLGDYA